MKKLIILSIVLITTLSATLLDNLSEPTIKEKPVESVFKRDIDVVKKLKLFNAKDYLKDYEHKKRAHAMMIEVTQEN